METLFLFGGYIVEVILAIKIGVHLKSEWHRFGLGFLMLTGPIIYFLGLAWGNAIIRACGLGCMIFAAVSFPGAFFWIKYGSATDNK